MGTVPSWLNSLYIFTDLTEIKRIGRKYYEYANKLENLNEINKFLERKTIEVTQVNLNISFIIKEIEVVIGKKKKNTKTHKENSKPKWPH